MREVSKQGSWGPGNKILMGNQIIYINLSEDKAEEMKILDFIDLKCSQGYEVKGFTGKRELILQKMTKLAKV